VHPQVTFEVRDKETVKQAISIICPIFAAYALVFFLLALPEAGKGAGTSYPLKFY